MDTNRENVRERILGKWAVWSSRNWGKSFLVIAAITALMIAGVSRLKLEMTFYSILPENTTQIRDLKMIMEEFPAASSIMAVVDARSVDDPLEAEKLVKKGIDGVVDRLSDEEFSQYVVRVTGKTDMDFYREHGLMFSKEKDIERSARRRTQGEKGRRPDD